MNNPEHTRERSQFPDTTRRGFLGHVCGLYVLASGVTIGGIAASALSNLIERHRIAEDIWIQTVDAEFANRNDETSAREAEANAGEMRALEAILNHRPETMEENAERIAYLYHGPWRGVVPDPDQIEMLLRSMTPLRAS